MVIWGTNVNDLICARYGGSSAAVWCACWGGGAKKRAIRLGAMCAAWWGYIFQKASEAVSRTRDLGEQH